MRCPICDKEFDRDASPAAPFCSDRCRSIDLGRWLGEVYSLPTESVDLDSDDSAADPLPRSPIEKPASDD
jgi:endogenous inhibitor of DNA gyrase (YacG/DUF329 family)